MDKAAYGYRALVPFGRQVLTGFIVGISDTCNLNPSKVKAVIDIIDDDPVFDSHMYSLAEWVADYYLASSGEVLRAAMPFGSMIRSRMRIYMTDAPVESTTLNERQTKVLDHIREHDGVLLRMLENSVGKSAAATVKALETKGLVRIERELSERKVKKKTIKYVLPGSAGKTISVRAREQRRCSEQLVTYPEGIELAEFIERHSFSRGVVNALVASGNALYEDRETTRTAALLEQEDTETDHPLTDGQTNALSEILTEAAKKQPRPILVRGITGSGKTRLYIELVRKALDEGKGAIVLVPEIALTPQTTRFFTSAFPNHVAVLHSGLSAGERFDMWHLINNGKRSVVIGPRSAIFAPLSNPGIIIVDEEHDSSYKQSDMSPRYHARDTAIMRARLLGIAVILGSATPSLESWKNALEGKYLLSTLASRIHSRPLPEVHTIDMRAERSKKNFSSLSSELRDELALRSERGEKSIILINRRGFATAVQCRDCGEVLNCPSCSVPLTYHVSKGLALCHVCGHSQLILQHCPNCGSTDLHHRGSGTQRLEQELSHIVDPSAIIRMDSDTTAGHDAHFRLLEEFRTGDASILLGTQMVAKGLDFPEVTLVGIISADASLYIPDFRAGERTFQLITQVSGRAGRGEKPGLVILQTFTPDNYAIEDAMHHDYIAFSEHELSLRREVEFPPFSRLVLIEVRSNNRNLVNGEADELVKYLKLYAPEGTEILGPVEAPIPRVRGKNRMHILLKTLLITRLLPIVRYAVEKHAKKNLDVIAEVDPIDMM